VPDLLIERLEKVATPLAAEMVVVPERVPEPGFVPMAIVIDAVEEVTVFPCASCTVITGWVAQALPAVPPEGWEVMASLDAVPGVTVMEVLLDTEAPERVAPRVTDPAIAPVRVAV
jgi:hypothetical protein